MRKSLQLLWGPLERHFSAFPVLWRGLRGGWPFPHAAGQESSRRFDAHCYEARDCAEIFRVKDTKASSEPRSASKNSIIGNDTVCKNMPIPPKNCSILPIFLYFDRFAPELVGGENGLCGRHVNRVISSYGTKRPTGLGLHKLDLQPGSRKFLMMLLPIFLNTFVMAGPSRPLEAKRRFLQRFWPENGYSRPENGQKLAPVTIMEPFQSICSGFVFIPALGVGCLTWCLDIN
jgi:hypothetical protein